MTQSPTPGAAPGHPAAGPAAGSDVCPTDLQEGGRGLTVLTRAVMLHPDRMVEVSAMSAAAMALAAATSSSSSSSPPPPPPSYKLISISSSQSIPRNADHHHAPSHGLA
eukprot:400906-Hanusia_phi.AAC.2